jgi:hypothetical protein
MTVGCANHVLNSQLDYHPSNNQCAAPLLDLGSYRWQTTAMGISLMVSIKYFMFVIDLLTNDYNNVERS